MEKKIAFTENADKKADLAGMCMVYDSICFKQTVLTQILIQILI